MEGPKSVGIIMDGNRRWANARGLPALEGHRQGLKALKEIVRATRKLGVTHLTVYAFSTENWERAPEEVSFLMTLFETAIKNELHELAAENIQLRFIGDFGRLPERLRELAQKAEEETKNNTSGTLAVALSYGGRAEIINAANTLIQEGREVITETDLQNALWTRDIPDPDLIIRTGGEQRLSNFLPWQSVYSELFFTDTLWPDFTPAELSKIFADYSARERRHGK